MSVVRELSKIGREEIMTEGIRKRCHMWEYDLYRLGGFYPPYATPTAWCKVEANLEAEEKGLKEHIEMLKEELQIAESELKELEKAA
jgi:hypothetical protein